MICSTDNFKVDGDVMVYVQIIAEFMHKTLDKGRVTYFLYLKKGQFAQRRSPKGLLERRLTYSVINCVTSQVPYDD